MYTPEVQAKIQLFRQKSLEGTITMDEMREAIRLLRLSRAAAAETSAKSRTRKAEAKAPVDTDALLGELGI